MADEWRQTDDRVKDGRGERGDGRGGGGKHGIVCHNGP